MTILTDLVGSLKFAGQLNRECRLYFICTSLNGIATGIFIVTFNLYILSMGISTEILGNILSVGPLAQAIGSIPVGFLMEAAGFKLTILMVYSIAGLSRLAQAATPSVWIIAASAFSSGLALSGDFVIRLPFLAANTNPDQRTQAFSFNSILFNVSMAVGSLLAGFVPNLFQSLGMDETGAYRLLLLAAGILSLVGIWPALLLKSGLRASTGQRAILAPYLWGIDRFTVQQAACSLFVGLSMGLANPFMNIYFLYHLGASREYFGAVSALAVFPALLATTLGPAFAHRIGTVRAVTILRCLIPVFTINLALTTAAWSGTLSLWMMNALFTTAQPLSFALVARLARQGTQPAIAAWLNITFWIGIAISAPLAGAFLGRLDYHSPLFISAGSIFAGGLLNDLFFHRREISARHAGMEEGTVEIKSS